MPAAARRQVRRLVVELARRRLQGMPRTKQGTIITFGQARDGWDGVKPCRSISGFYGVEGRRISWVYQQYDVSATGFAVQRVHRRQSVGRQWPVVKSRYFLQLVALSALWGSSFMLTRFATPILRPNMLAALRMGMATGALILLACTLVTGFNPLQRFMPVRAAKTRP